MKAPGKAYDSELLGKDPQPDHMSKFVHLPDTEEGDNGGVHINSGIPNKAFYLVAVGLGGYAEAAGLIWYEALKASTMTTQFQEFADTTYLKAGSFTARAALNRKRCWLDGAMSASESLACPAGAVLANEPRRPAEGPTWRPSPSRLRRCRRS